MSTDTYLTFIEEQLKEYQEQVDRALEEHYISNERVFGPTVEITQQDLASRLKEFNTRPSKHIRGIVPHPSCICFGEFRVAEAGIDELFL